MQICRHVLMCNPVFYDFHRHRYSPLTASMHLSHGLLQLNGTLLDVLRTNMPSVATQLTPAVVVALPVQFPVDFRFLI